MRSNAAARSASSAHTRLQVFPRAVTKIACIASWQERPGRNPYDRDSNRASHSGSSAPTARACNALSATTGIPRPRTFPPFFGMNTRLTGRGLHAVAPCWSQAAMSAFPQLASTTLPSTPAVLRPALISVARRTLTSALARDRSSQLLQTTDLLQVPCLARREDPLPQPPYVILGPSPVHTVPVQNIALRSVHLTGVQLAHRF